MQYIGEIYNIDSTYGKKKLEEYKNKNCTYLMSLSNNEVIDPTYKGNLARFINHSCDPNCLTQKWYVLGEQCIGIFTLRDINEGEELTFNYNFNIYKTTFQKCLCGVGNCKGYLGVARNETIDKINNCFCYYCKNNVRTSDKIIACEICSKIFHHNCTKKSKFNLILSNCGDIEKINNFFKTNFIFKISDFNNIFLCNSCMRKNIKKDKKIPSIADAAGIPQIYPKEIFKRTKIVYDIDNENEDGLQEASNLQALGNLKIEDVKNGKNSKISIINLQENSVSLKIVENNNEEANKKSLQEIIEKNNNKTLLLNSTEKNILLEAGNISNVNNSNNIANNQTGESLSYNTEYAVTMNIEQEKEDFENNLKNLKDQKFSNEENIESNSMLIDNISGINEFSSKSDEEEEDQEAEEEEDEFDEAIIDQNIEVDSKNLKIIRANLNTLSTIGARLFWDFRQITSQPQVEIKITGSKSQINKVKEQINKILSNGNFT